MTASTADARIQELATSIYRSPLAEVRSAPDYPDIEITMQGMLGFLENSTGRHLGPTREALRRIGALRSAELFASIEACMARHGVTWERLRGESADAEEFEVTSFAGSHPDAEDFADEVEEIAGRFSVLDPKRAPDDVYALLCAYVGACVAQLDEALAKALSAGACPA